MRILRRTPIHWCSPGIFAVLFWCSANAAPNTLDLSLSQTTQQQNPTQQAHIHIKTARTIIADAIPEERPLAEQELIEATRLCRTCVDAYAELGRLWITDYAMGRAGVSSLQKAAAMAELTKELEPESPRGDYLGVEVLLTIGRQSEAFQLYSAARQVYPDHIETLAFESRLWAEVDPERALKEAQKAIARGFPVQELAPWIGNALVKISDEGQSGSALQKFAEVYPDRWLWHRAALAYSEQKNWKAARHAFEKAISLGNNLESPLQLAILEYKELNNPKQAATRLEMLTKIADKQGSLSFESRALLESHAAFAYLAAKNQNLARQHAEKALDLSVSNDARVSQIVEKFRDENRLWLLKDALQRVSLSNPLMEEVHLALAVISSQAKDYTGAIDYLSSAITLAPERDDLYSARGQASYLASHYEVALQDFETAIKQKPEHAPYHYNKACLLSLLGRNSEAFESLKTAIVMSDSLRVQAGRDSDLENLRQDKEFEAQLANLGVVLPLLNSKGQGSTATTTVSSASPQNSSRVRPSKISSDK